MNIRHYYKQTANTALNAALISIIPIIIFLFIGLFWIQTSKWLIILIPFFIYSFICYQYYLLYDRRSNEIETITPNVQAEGDILKGKSLLLGFMPAPSLRMLFFRTDGTFAGEIRDLDFKIYRWFLPYFIDRIIPQKYGLFNNREELLVEYKYTKDFIKILDDKRHLVGIVEPIDQSYTEMIFRKNKFQFQSEILLPDVRITNSDGELLGQLKHGWMPLEWKNQFKDDNTPILTFDDSLTREEKMMVLALLARKYRYRNH